MQQTVSEEIITTPASTRTRTTGVLLGLLILGSLIVRLVALGSLPSNLMADEADNLVVIYTVLYGQGPGIFGLDWKPNPALSLYFAAPFVALFKESVMGLRLPSVLTSVLALVPLYALYRRHTSPPAALLALALLSSSVWYLNFSRSGWENVHIVLLTALGVWLLVRALETFQWRYWALAGVVASLGLYGYFAGRVLLVALLAYAPFALWQHRRHLGWVIAGYALLGVTAVAVFVPQLPAIARNPESFNRRAERVSVMRAAQTEAGYFGEQGRWNVLRYQLTRNARFFWDGDALGGSSYSPPEQLLKDTRPRYSPFGSPLLDPITGLAFLLGMLLSLRRWLRYSLWWVMLLVPWLLTQVLTINTPDAARGIGMLPAIFFFVALTLDRAWQAGRSMRPLRPALLLLFAITTTVTTVGYFQWATSPELLEAREPAVALEDFQEWSQLQIQRARAGQPLLPVSVWKEFANGD